MQKDDLVLSDVHLQVKSSYIKNRFLSRFYFCEDKTVTKRKKSANEKNEEIDEQHVEGGLKKSTNEEILSENNGNEQEAKNGKERKQIHKIKNQNINTREQSIVENISVTVNRNIICGSHQTEDDCLPQNDSEKQNATVYLKKDRDCCGKSDNSVNREPQHDEDGDVDVPRRKRKLTEYSVVTIAHNLETTLENVGKQIWLASLLMVDFLISNKEEFKGKRILDLGAGVGLTSVVATMYADYVICTDIGKDILELAQYNLETNNSKEVNNFKVEELDWFENRFTRDTYHHRNRKNCKDSAESCDTVITAESCDLIISADVIYDDVATDALFRTVYGLMLYTDIQTWYISIEKRYVFTLNDLDIACPAYQHFSECLTQLVDMDEGFTVSNVGDFPQYLQYNKTKELELWKVTRIRPDQ